jgi:beta-N-acetylhexosaminidase
MNILGTTLSRRTAASNLTHEDDAQQEIDKPATIAKMAPMSDGRLLLLGIEGAEVSPDEASRIRTLQPAGFVLFSRNLVSPHQTRKLTDDLRGLCDEVPIIAIDEEGGRVARTRVFAPPPPSPPALVAHLASGDRQNTIARSACATADLLLMLGVNLDFAPVLDLDHHPGVSNALRGRCWGRDPQRVIDHAGTWNRWLRKRGIAGCGKHFPAGGRATSDPHHDLPSCDAGIEDLLAEDVLPYTALMSELDAVMLGHVRFPNIDPVFPASLSPRIIRRFLRDQLGFDDHVILTDDLDMGAITRLYARGQDARLAIEAGNDLAMICHHAGSAPEAAMAIAELPLWLRDEACERIDRLRRKFPEPPPWNESRFQSHADAVAAIAAEVPETGETDGCSPVAGY